MKTNYEIRYAAHPEDARAYDTGRLRRDFLIERLFAPNEVNMVYSMYDRMVVGGAARVQVDGASFTLDYKEALYLGRGDRQVTFASVDPAHPAQLYFMGGENLDYADQDFALITDLR